MQLTDEGLLVASKMQDYFENRQRIYWPMICEPVAWTTGRDGGYINDYTKQLIFGPSEIVEEQVERITDNPPQDVLDAVNAAQATPWRINETILRVILKRYRRQLAGAGLPSRFKPEPRPVKPYVDVKNPTKADRKLLDDWREERDQTNDRNRETLSRMRAFKQAVHIACDANKHDRIWFAHKLDKRGRLYPNTAGLAPQGAKMEKALLEFADGKPLGPNGAYWLAFELANNWAGDVKVTYEQHDGIKVGLDKAYLEDRIAWVEDNQDLILRSVSHMDDEDAPWTKAENPLGFLRAAIEWCGYLVQGEDYVSHLNINLDGSNSGIQHYAGLLRDRETAMKVSVVTSDVGPQDIYEQVVVETKRIMREDLAAGIDKEDERKRVEWWLDNLSRKIVKQPGMTFTYSACTFGMAGQIRKAMRDTGLVDPLEGNKKWPMRHISMAAAKRVNRAIRNIVGRPAEAMSFLQELTETMVRAGVRPEWTTPLGFPCVQNYWESNSKMKEVKWCGSKRQYRMAESNHDALKVSKHVSSVSPNFVHSLDSTHLMQTINRMSDYGFEHLSIIHDSIGCHAADVDELAYAVRDEFRLLYGNTDLLADLKQQFETLAGRTFELDNEDGRTQRGLDINLVMDSELFFA
jgi:DNA-directed RNA polymerase